jgi:hypothetical protein
MAEGRLGVIAMCACIYVGTSMRDMYIRAVLSKRSTYSPYTYTFNVSGVCFSLVAGSFLATKRREIHAYM